MEISEKLLLFREIKENEDLLLDNLDILNELYDEAKDAYYNTSEAIMEDSDFDLLEEMIGKSNLGYIGSKHNNYTVQHPFIMGSLDKVHTDIDRNGNINYDEVADAVVKHLKKSMKPDEMVLEASPKFDGVSFEAVINNRSGKANLVSVSTRGDGEYGKDIRSWFLEEFDSERWSDKDAFANRVLTLEKKYLVVRGEILVNKRIYEEKFSDQFKNTRAMCAGTVGTDWIGDDEQLERRKSLSFVCYDYRIFDRKTNTYTEIDYLNGDTLNEYKMLGERPDFSMTVNLNTYHSINYEKEYTDYGNIIREIYEKFDAYRNSTGYALDGIVIKPLAWNRQYNNSRRRPEDCIAIKFIQQMQDSEIVDIAWNVAKTGECIPTAICKPVYMDGKEITRASLSNYNNLVKNHVGIGSKIKISLAGDIIPFIYEVVSHSDDINLPKFKTYERVEESGTIHLMKELSSQEKRHLDYMASIISLGIPGIGDKVGNKLYESLQEYDIDKYEDLSNITSLMNESSYDDIQKCLGESKSTSNIIKELEAYKKKMNLVDLIKSCNFSSIGSRSAEVCAKMMSKISYDTTGFSIPMIEWALDETSEKYKMVEALRKKLGIPYLEENNESGDLIHIIMTGDPSACTQYGTKKQWLAAHPQYVETSKWSECDILFTNDLTSETSKMKQAKKKGIEIRQYED